MKANISINFFTHVIDVCNKQTGNMTQISVYCQLPIFRFLLYISTPIINNYIKIIQNPFTYCNVFPKYSTAVLYLQVLRRIAFTCFLTSSISLFISIYIFICVSYHTQSLLLSSFPLHLLLHYYEVALVGSYQKKKIILYAPGRIIGLRSN